MRLGLLGKSIAAATVLYTLSATPWAQGPVKPASADARPAANEVVSDSHLGPSETVVQLDNWRAGAARFIAQGYFARGWQRLARGELQPALEDFERGLELDPTRLDAALERARLLLRLSRPDEAIDGYRLWLSRAEASAEAHSAASIAVRLELINALSGLGRPREALAELERLPASEQRSIAALRMRARWAEGLGAREALLEVWLEWASHPDASSDEAARLLDQAAQLAEALGQHRQALRITDSLARRGPTLALSRRQAFLLERLGERRAAIEAWQKVLDESVDANERLRVVDAMRVHARALGDLELERSLLERALALSGQAVDRLRDLTLFESRTGRGVPAARHAITLAARSRLQTDRAMAFERLLAIDQPGAPDSSAATAKALLAELERLASRAADHGLRRLIADHQSDRGRDTEALSILESLARSAPASIRRTSLMRIAEIQARRGQPRARALALLEADRLPGPAPLTWSERVALLVAVGRREEALAVLEAKRSDTPDDPELLRGLIDLHREAGDIGAVLAGYQALARSARLSSVDRAAAHREAAEVARRLPDGVEQALFHYRQAIDRDPGFRPTRLALAETLVGIGQAAQAAQVYDELFQASAEPAHALRAIELLLAAGDPDAARARFDAYEAPQRTWPADSRFSFWMSRGRFELDTGSVEAAIAAWASALALRPDPQLALRLRGLKARVAREQAEQARIERRLPEAVRAWRLAEGLEPNAVASQGLAYALLESDEPAQAAKAFARALKHLDPPPGPLLADLGYAHLRAGERGEARAAFVRAIDTLETEQGPSGRATIETLRREIRELDQTLSGALWQGWRDRGARGLAAGTTGAGAADGWASVPAAGGGIDLAWREPLARAPGRSPFEWFGRLLWAIEPGTTDLDRRATQLGLGLRIRPQSTPHAWVSAERLFAVGGDGQDEWLLRAAWGRSWGALTGPGWGGHLWADVAYQTGSRTRALYAEWRQAYAWVLAGSTRLLPHAVLHGRGLDPDPYGEAWAEAGLGLSIEGAAGGGRHVAPWVHWRTFLRYKFRLDGAGPDGWELGVSILW